MWPYRHAGAGRRELGRVVLTSLATAARIELDARRARGQRLRARRAERRLAELEEALDRFERGAPPLTPAWHSRPEAELATVLAAFASVGVLAAVAALRGPQGLLVGALDVVMLLATVTWFCVAVSRRTRPRGVTVDPPDGGSPPPGVGR